MRLSVLPPIEQGERQKEKNEGSGIQKIRMTEKRNTF
jgi:hypothetical protein